jgi:hypothetical protein
MLQCKGTQNAVASKNYFVIIVFLCVYAVGVLV